MAIDITKTSIRNAVSKNAYADLDLLFQKHPNTGDVVIRTDAEAVKRSVKNIILTNHYERPFKPNFGGSIRELLFELNTDRKIRKVKERLKSMLEAFEPRIHRVQIGLTGVDRNEVNVQVNYSIKNGVKNQNIEMTLTRAR
tara:strand:+ start:156 stop:578 length:423 start_codon:yes stop_codon:yes gene_type:complete